MVAAGFVNRKERENRYEYQGTYFLHRLLGLHWLLHGNGSGMGVVAVNSYKDYLRLKWLKPIVIERTKKMPGDYVIISGCLPAVKVKP